MNLFIDANILLDFYHFSGPDIEELRKLIALLETGDVKLFVTDQLCEEFKRNRDNKINTAIAEFKKVTFTISFPAFVKLYDEYGQVQDLLKEANKKHSDLFKKAMHDAVGGTLKADEVIGELFSKSERVNTTDQIYLSALRRQKVGNPPGKKKAVIGDEINWEALLDSVPRREDLHLVSDDSDYFSSLDPQRLNPFLLDEWRKTKKSTISYYRTLPDFFKRNFPKIKLATDVKVNALIERLAMSGSFATTHSMIAALSEIAEFSPSQVEELIQIAELNNQVNWIIQDEDVLGFYTRLKDTFGKHISEQSRETLNALVTPAFDIAEDDDVPF